MRDSVVGENGVGNLLEFIFRAEIGSCQTKNFRLITVNDVLSVLFSLDSKLGWYRVASSLIGRSFFCG